MDRPDYPATINISMIDRDDRTYKHRPWGTYYILGSRVWISATVFFACGFAMGVLWHG